MSQRHLSPSDQQTERLARELRETNFQLNQKLVQLETLYEAGLSLGASLQIEEIVGEFLYLAMALVDARGGFLFLRDERTRQLCLAQHANFEQSQLDLLCSGPLYAVLKKALRGPRYLSPEDLPPDMESRFLLAVPVGREGLVGVVDKETRQGVQPFGEEDAHLLELMCQQAGTALANARLYRSMLEEKNLNQSIVRSIANGVISTDLEGRIVRTNPAVERIFSGERTFVGRSCAHLFQRQGCPRIAAAVRSGLKDGQERQIDAEQVPERNLSLNARINPLRDEEGRVLGLVVALEDLSEQTRLRSMFKQYASDQVVEALLQSDRPPSLGGERCYATMLFADLAASTELLNELGAEEMVHLLNDCFTRLVDVIFDHRGTLNKYTGDGFLAVFGAPLAFADDARRAAQSALAIHTAMERFNRDNGLHWGIKIGMSQGTVTAGNVGSLRRMEYTVIGPQVNLAARLMDRSQAGETLVDANVYETLKEDFAFASLGAHTFKHIREPVHIYQLLASADQRPAGAEKGEGQKETARQGRIDLDIPMLSDMELTAAHTAEAVGLFMGLHPEKIEEVKMALVEACINAIEHSQSKDQRLKIGFEVGEEGLKVSIQDRGHGFDVEAMREKLRKRRESGQRFRGWGLQLMEELMDEVEVESGRNGTRITFLKRR